MKALQRFLQDDKGNYSHARLIALLVGFSATVFMWKLTIGGQLTSDYLLYYLAYGIIHMNVSKALDVLNNFLGRKNDEGIRRAPDYGGDPYPTQGRGGRGGYPESLREDIRDSGDGAGRKTEDFDPR